MCHWVLLRYFIGQSSSFYLASFFMPCPNVFSSGILNFPPYSCVRFEIPLELFNSCFIIAAWLDLLCKLPLSLVSCVYHGLTFLFTVIHKGRHSVFSLPLKSRGISTRGNQNTYNIGRFRSQGQFLEPFLVSIPINFSKQWEYSLLSHCF